MPKFKVTATWSSWATFEIEAPSEDAIHDDENSYIWEEVDDHVESDNHEYEVEQILSESPLLTLTREATKDDDA